MPTQDTDREIYRENDDEVIIKTVHRQTFQNDEYSKVIENVRSQIQEREDKLDQIKEQQENILETDSGDELKTIHSIVDEEPQEMQVIESNSVSPSSVNKYVQLRNMEDQKKELKNELADLREDLEELIAMEESAKA